MAFNETPRFPDDIAQGAAGGPGYSTEVAVTFGGAESRNINWAAARGEWEVATGIKTAADYAEVLDFFRMCRGKAHGFRFKDWSDYKVDAADGVLVLVAGAVYQMVRRYGSGATAEDRTITKPIAGTVTVYRTRAGVTTTIATTIDYTTGGVTVAGHAGGDTYTWAGEFDVPVRFDTDKLRTVLVGPTRAGDDDRPLMSWESVPVIEIRVAGAA